MYTKVKLYNLALGALLLQRQVVDPLTDASNENKVLNTHWDAALFAALEEMDLDGTSSSKTLELIEEDPDTRWLYSYKYPSDCAFIRRVETGQVQDGKDTRIPLKIMIRDGVKCILTNQEEATIEYVSSDIPISALSANAGLAVAYKLASMSMPLIVGKGADKLTASLEVRYARAKAAAQEHDAKENFIFDDPEATSTWVRARLE